MGVAEPFFDPFADGLAAHPEGAGESAQARAFLVGVEDGLFFLVGVGVAARVLAVLFATGFALVALSAVGCESVLEEVFAVAVGAGQGDLNRHQVSILT